MLLTDIVIDIHQRETGSRVEEPLAAELHELAETYGVDQQPRWLLPMFRMVQQGSETAAPVFFERESSDPHSYLLELCVTLRWKFDHPGEYDEIEFPKLGMRIFISHESHSPVTGRSGSDYQVTRLAR